MSFTFFCVWGGFAGELLHRCPAHPENLGRRGGKRRLERDILMLVAIPGPCTEAAELWTNPIIPSCSSADLAKRRTRLATPFPCG